MPETAGARGGSSSVKARQPRYGRDDYARRGAEIYERVRPEIESGNHGRIVGIDVETGAYEIADDLLKASSRLLACHPNAQVWFVRIGHRGVHRFGPRAASVLM
jgi:hypothetical protein